MDESIIAPVRGRKIKKRSKLKWILLSAFSLVLILMTTYGGYWYGNKYPEEINRLTPEEALRLNQTLILQGAQREVNRLLNTSLSCNPTIILYKNSSGDDNGITLFPFECLSYEEQLCLIPGGDSRNAPQ